jgi:small subunit ribosomal protein S16
MPRDISNSFYGEKMVRIRLARMGRKRNPFYRVVAADSRAPRDGKFIEILGTYNPMKDPMELNFKMDRIEHWINHGAQPSDTVSRLIKRVRNQSDGETKDETSGTN